MSEEAKQNDVKTAFNKAIENLSEMRGGVTAFILLAVTDEPARDGAKNAMHGINSSGGNMKDLVNLFKNIDSKIKTAAAMQDLFEIMDKL